MGKPKEAFSQLSFLSPENSSLYQNDKNNHIGQGHFMCVLKRSCVSKLLCL